MDITKACRAISELTPLAQQACNLFIARCKSAGLDILLLKRTAHRKGQDKDK